VSRERPHTEREPGIDQRQPSDRSAGVPDAAYRRLHEAVAGDGDPAERRQALLSVVREAVDADTAFLSRVDPAGGRRRVVAAVGEDIVPAGTETDLDTALCRHVTGGGEFALADARTAPEEPDYWRFGVGSYLGVAVAVEDGTVGTLAVAGVSPRAYTEDERALVRAGADLVGTEPAMVEAADGASLGARPLSVPASWFEGGMFGVDEDRRVTRVDDAAASILGREPAAVVGETPAAALGDRRGDLAVEEARRTGEPVAFECRDGDRLLWVGVYPSGDGANVYLREATERSEHEQVLERVTDGFLSLDADLSFRYVNSHAGDLLGRAPESLVGASVTAMATAETPDDAVERALPRAVRRARTGGETVDFEARTPGRQWVHGRAYPDDDGVSVYLHDVTERRRREQLLDGLLSHTRELMSVESRRAVADVVTDAVEDVVGFERVVVYLQDDHDLLVPAGSLDDPNALSTGPIHEPGEGTVGRAFSDDEPRVSGVTTDDTPSPPGGGDGEGPLLAVPLGDHGVVAVHGTPGATVDEDDVSLVSLLAETAVAALDRARRSERLSTYEEVLDASRDLVYAIDDGGQLTFVSPALADRLGYDADDLTGEHLTAILPRAGSQAVADAVRRLPRLEDDSVAVETEARTAADERTPVAVAVSVIPDDEGPAGAVGVVREIDDLEAVREELSQERTRFSRLFEALPDPALEVEVDPGRADADATVEAVNHAFEQAFDVDATSVVGESLADALGAGSGVPTDTAEEDPVERVTRAIRDRRSVSFQLRQATSDGPRDFVFQAIPYRETDGSVQAFGIYTDITEQRDRERRLEVLNRVLRHNMRTQLNVVDGYADYLGNELADVDAAPGDGDDETVTVDVDADALTAARKVRDAAGRVLDLTDQARRTLEMIDRDRDDGPVDLAAVARSVVEEYDTEHPAATVDLVVRATDGDGEDEGDGDGSVTPTDEDGRSETTDSPEVVADVGHDVGLALAQLVENGIVHNQDGAHVEVTVTPADDGVRVTVSDDGPGIPGHERAVVAGETEPTQLEHGSGLGLWVTRWVVEGYGGTVRFPEDEAGDDGDFGGATVTLQLPSV